jgi:hypothetical protein
MVTTTIRSVLGVYAPVKSSTSNIMQPFNATLDSPIYTPSM